MWGERKIEVEALPRLKVVKQIAKARTYIGTISLRFWGCPLLVLDNPREIAEPGLIKLGRLRKTSLLFSKNWVHF